jgi:hypothetical protein
MRGNKRITAKVFSVELIVCEEIVMSGSVI